MDRPNAITRRRLLGTTCQGLSLAALGSLLPAWARSGADAAMTPPLGDTATRLNEKILEAFNHAYAIGATEIAARLRALLEGPEPGTDLLSRAQRWTAFVEARDAYRKLLGDPAGDSDAADRALAAMKETYRLWSRG